MDRRSWEVSATRACGAKREVEGDKVGDVAGPRAHGTLEDAEVTRDSI